MDWVLGTLQFALPLLLIVLGFVVGRRRDAAHRRSLTQREGSPGPALTNLRHLPTGRRAGKTFFCLGSVVIANDYYKAFGAKLKNLVGGRLRTLESLLERGRREALQRLREDARAGGATIVLNVRLTTARITGRKAGGAVEVVAYGTGVVDEPAEE